MYSSNFHTQENPLLADDGRCFSPFSERDGLETNPAEVLHEHLGVVLRRLAVEAHVEALAVELVEAAQLHQRHEARLQIADGGLGVEEDEHGLAVVFTGDESAEPGAADIVPHLDPLAHGAALREAVIAGGNGRGVRWRRQTDAAVVGSVDGLVVGVIVNVVHTHCKRVLAGRVPLTKENGLQCLTEESLTLFRNGACSPPSARHAETLVRRAQFVTDGIGGEGGTLWR